MRTLRLLPALLLTFAATAHAQDARSPGDSIAPVRSNVVLWGISGAALGGAFLLDRRVEEMIPEGGGEGHVRLLDALDHLGRPQALVPLTGAVWAAGKLTRRPQLSASAAHVLIALAAGGVANGTLKYIVGRERPGVEGDRWAFRPFNPNNSWQSFPSGHVVVGFSFAEAVAMEAGRPWVRVVMYGAASTLAWSRVYEDKHWTSDVVAGALIGIGAGRLAVGQAHRRAPDAHGRTPIPPRVTLLPGGVAVTLSTR